jgi:hypothetical protein
MSELRYAEMSQNERKFLEMTSEGVLRRLSNVTTSSDEPA